MKMEYSPTPIRGSRSALMHLSLLRENFLRFHFASWEHNASSAGASPSHSDCKDKHYFENYKVIGKKIAQERLSYQLFCVYLPMRNRKAYENMENKFSAKDFLVSHWRD